MSTQTTEEAESTVPNVVPPAPEPARPPSGPATRKPRLITRRRKATAARAIAGTLALAALFTLGFVVYLYGLSGVSENRVQNTMWASFAGALNAATAPVGTATEGDPVAVLDIPKLGLYHVMVVEGTTSRDLTRGPGHVIASALPGQYGVSVIYGKVATFGAPFAHLMRLNRGDAITVTTGEGTATYVVESFGDSKNPAPDTTANRLVLMTADSDTSPSPSYFVQVTADLKSDPAANPGHRPAVPDNQKILKGDVDSLIPLLLWSQALLLVSLGGSVAARVWSRWPAYLCAAPVVVAVTWNVYENLAGLLSNVY